jgi:hypothetical protein
MEHVLTDQIVRQALRGEICTVCPLRPPGSESLGPEVARSCEIGCPIFTNLEPLKAIAAAGQENPLVAYERAIREQVCQKCTASVTAGDYCYEGFSRTCPLSIMAPNVLLVIESLLSGRVTFGDRNKPPA